MQIPTYNVHLYTTYMNAKALRRLRNTPLKPIPALTKKLKADILTDITVADIETYYLSKRKITKTLIQHRNLPQNTPIKHIYLPPNTRHYIIYIIYHTIYPIIYIGQTINTAYSRLLSHFSLCAHPPRQERNRHDRLLLHILTKYPHTQWRIRAIDTYKGTTPKNHKHFKTIWGDTQEHLYIKLFNSHYSQNNNGLNTNKYIPSRVKNINTSQHNNNDLKIENIVEEPKDKNEGNNIEETIIKHNNLGETTLNNYDTNTDALNTIRHYH
jgi:hypothetical protein